MFVVRAWKGELQSTEGFTATSCQPHLVLDTVEREIHLLFTTYFTLQCLSVTPPSLIFAETLIYELDNWKQCILATPKLISHIPSARAPQPCLLQVLHSLECQHGSQVKKKIKMISQRKISIFHAVISLVTSFGNTLPRQ